MKCIGDYHGLVIRSQTKVTPEVFAAATNLKAIGRAGVGVDNIDRDAATDHGVVVMNTPSGNTISTAEHAFALMLSLARNIGPAHSSMIQGRFDRKLYTGVEMFGKRLAILGMGRIGTEFAKRAQAFGMKVVALRSLPHRRSRHITQSGTRGNRCRCPHRRRCRHPTHSDDTGEQTHPQRENHRTHEPRRTHRKLRSRRTRR